MSDAWNLSQYDKFKNERSQPFFDLMDLVGASSVPKRMIDLGCGSGELTEVLHKKLQAQETLGLDNSVNMLEKAQSLQAAGLSFKLDAIENISGHGKFDVIFSNAAIQWCDDHPALFRKIVNQLNPQGQLAVQMPMNHDYPTHVIAEALGNEEPYRTWLSAKGGARKSPMLTPEVYAKMLFDLGFKEQKVFLRVYPHVLDSREGVIEWVQGTLLTYYKSRLSIEQYQQFVTEFKKRLFGQLPDENPFFYPFKRILMWGSL